MHMKDILKSRIFWLTTVLFAGFFFTATLNLNKTNQSEIDVLLLPKSDATVRNISQIVGNAKQIPHNLSFYNKMLELNPDIQDTLNNLSDDKRKQAWDSMIEIKQIRKSGLLRIKTLSTDQWQAELLSKQAADSLVAVMSRYYDIKTELEVRIVDGPIASQAVKTNIALGVLISLVLGSACGFLISTLTKLVSERIKREAPQETIEFKQRPSIFPKFSFPEFGAKTEKKPILDFKIEEEEALVQPKKEAVFNVGGKKASAPENLPIADNYISSMLSGKDEISTSVSADEAEIKFEAKPALKSETSEMEKNTTREATPEEVRERLNKLLGGGMLK